MQLLVGQLLREVRGDELRLALLIRGELVPPAAAIGLGGLEPPLALALENRNFISAVARCLLVRLLELRDD